MTPPRDPHLEEHGDDHGYVDGEFNGAGEAELMQEWQEFREWLDEKMDDEEKERERG